MNKLITSLAKQAGLAPYYEAQEADIERFARLVARHCTDITQSYAYEADNQIVNSTCSIITMDILTEFNKD